MIKNFSIPALEDGPATPNFHDEAWRAFTLAKEANSALAEKEWRRYRVGLRRLERAFEKRVPVRPMRRALAEDAFFCAAHWGHSPRIVRGCLDELLRHSIGVKTFAFAAAEFWAWASRTSPGDLTSAEAMLAQARTAMDTRPLDPLSRDNLQRMLAVVVDQHRRQP